MSKGKGKFNSTAHCPECGSSVHFQKKPVMGQVTSCRKCRTRLEVVDVAPLELDWASEHAYDRQS